jgi:hypothetical protein
MYLALQSSPSLARPQRSLQCRKGAAARGYSCSNPWRTSYRPLGTLSRAAGPSGAGVRPGRPPTSHGTPPGRCGQQPGSVIPILEYSHSRAGARFSLTPRQAHPHHFVETTSKLPVLFAQRPLQENPARRNYPVAWHHNVDDTSDPGGVPGTRHWTRPGFAWRPGSRGLASITRTLPAHLASAARTTACTPGVIRQ